VKALALRWFKFNVVGGLGVAIQMGCLALLYKGLHLNYLVATALAVEAAVLHNFAWHERFTWKDRKHAGARDRWMRLLRFHAGNGLVSIAGNVVLMGLLVGRLHIHYLVANGISIAICSFINFALSEWFVFRR
jgi:putative flippase GtrA